MERKVIAKLHITLKALTPEEIKEMGKNEDEGQGFNFSADVDSSGKHIKHMLETLCESDEGIQEIFMNIAKDIAMKNVLGKILKGKAKPSKPKAGPKEQMVKDFMDMLNITPGE